MTTPVLYIGPKNAETVIGRSPRWCLDLARAENVQVLRVRRAWLIPAEQLRAAIERAANVSPAPTAVVDEGDELAALRARMGKKRRTA